MTPLLLALLLFGRPAAAAEAHPNHVLASFTVDMSRPLAGRVAPIPDWLLALWRKVDETPAYANHELTSKEKREFKAAIDGLPPRMRSALGERLIAFYFVALHLTHDLGRPYRLTCGGKAYEPMSNPRVEQRAQRILAPMVAAGE